MSDIATLIDYQLPVVSSFGRNSLGPLLVGVNATLPAASAWSSANLAVFIPIMIGSTYTAVKMFWINGATVGTNHVDVGVYDSQGNQLVHIGSTLTAGASVIQSVDTTDITISPGLYYLAMVMDGTTDTVLQGGGGNLVIPLTGGAKIQATAFPLPSPAIYASFATATNIPFFGMTSSTVI